MVKSSVELERTIIFSPPGKTVEMEVYRDGKKLSMQVTLEERPAEERRRIRRVKITTGGVARGRTQESINSVPKAQGIKDSRTQGLKDSRTQGLKDSRIQGLKDFIAPVLLNS